MPATPINGTGQETLRKLFLPELKCQQRTTGGSHEAWSLVSGGAWETTDKDVLFYFGGRPLFASSSSHASILHSGGVSCFLSLRDLFCFLLPCMEAGRNTGQWVGWNTVPGKRIRRGFLLQVLGLGISVLGQDRRVMVGRTRLKLLAIFSLPLLSLRVCVRLSYPDGGFDRLF